MGQDWDYFISTTSNVLYVTKKLLMLLFCIHCYSQIFVPIIFPTHQSTHTIKKFSFQRAQRTISQSWYLLFANLLSPSWSQLLFIQDVCVMFSGLCKLPYVQLTATQLQKTQIESSKFFHTEMLQRSIQSSALKLFFTSALRSGGFLIYKFGNIFALTPSRSDLLWHFS